MVYSEKVTVSVKETLREQSSTLVSSQDGRALMPTFISQQFWSMQTSLSIDHADLTTRGSSIAKGLVWPLQGTSWLCNILWLACGHAGT